MSMVHTLVWAGEFKEILPTLAQRDDLRERVTRLLPQPIAGKVTEGVDRAQQLRGILGDVVAGMLTLPEAYLKAEQRLPRLASPHSASNRVFADGWAERLVRTQLSRFYNQAVLGLILEGSERRCFVPHSSEEQPDSPCSLHLAGKDHDAGKLLDLLVDSYAKGLWPKSPKIPDHPHCTHVVRPIAA